MEVELIVSTMFEKDYSLIKKINIKSKAIFVNQCDNDSYKELDVDGYRVIWINSSERGLSKSRNLALRYVTGDVVLLVDNDEVLADDYVESISYEFYNQNADLITFNINSLGHLRERYINTKRKKLSKHNIFRYGSARIAFKSSFIKKHRISFDEKFGAGTSKKCGEDSIFLNDVLSYRGMCKTSPYYIANIDDASSTWFDGYNEEYFFNIGCVLKRMFPHFTRLIILFYLFKHKKITKTISFKKARYCMINGSKSE